MKNSSSGAVFFACLFGLLSCAGEPEKIIIYPESSRLANEAAEPYQIIESQSGPADAAMPGWVNQYLSGGAAGVETLDAYSDKYIFIGQNRGTNFNALNQWTARFTPAQDFPRLAAARIEKRLIAAASLYPDDEYGQFFELMIREASDAEYSGATREDSFWIKHRINRTEEAFALSEAEQEDNQMPYPAVQEVYDFFVLTSIDKAVLQTKIRNLMENIKTDIPPTRDQSVSRSRIQQSFFERF
jgi:hypothetical protein